MLLSNFRCRLSNVRGVTTDKKYYGRFGYTRADKKANMHNNRIKQNLKGHCYSHFYAKAI